MESLACVKQCKIDETLLKVEELRASLPAELDHREQTMKVYGWIADAFPEIPLPIPMENDHQYARTYSVELILTDLDMYNKIIRWD